MPRMRRTRVIVACMIGASAVASCGGRVEATQNAGGSPGGSSGSASGSSSGSIASEDGAAPSDAAPDDRDSNSGSSSGSGGGSSGESGSGSDSGSASVDQQCAMAPNTGSYTCLDCCISSYVPGEVNYYNNLLTTTTTNCVCSGPCSGPSECGEDPYCVDGGGQGISTQGCFDCARRAVATGGSCAFSCTGDCQSYETCLDGCSQ